MFPSTSTLLEPFRRERDGCEGCVRVLPKGVRGPTSSGSETVPFRLGGCTRVRRRRPDTVTPENGEKEDDVSMEAVQLVCPPGSVKEEKIL